MASGGAGPSSSMEQDLSEDVASLIGAMFLQFIQKRGFVALLDAIDFLKTILHFQITETQLESIRQELNREVAVDDFEIRRLVYPVSHLSQQIAKIPPLRWMIRPMWPSSTLKQTPSLNHLLNMAKILRFSYSSAW